MFRGISFVIRVNWVEIMVIPVIHRSDLSFDECIVIELNFGRKKIFFTVLYRSPASKQGSPKIELFLSYFKNLHAKTMSETPYATFFTDLRRTCLALP